ncbi:MAG: YfiR family protein [Betaproteobacteria bacterium]
MALLAGAAALSAADGRTAEGDVSLEYRVKAAFLYQIAGYVEWPGHAFPRRDTPVTIGVLGAEPLAKELSRIAPGRTIGNRRIAVRRLTERASLEGVQVLFIGRDRRSQIADLAQKASERAALVVTESEGALAEGSMVNFVLVDGRVRFEVGLDAARRSGLTLSSRLLAVAEHVHSGAP